MKSAIKQLDSNSGISSLHCIISLVLMLLLKCVMVVDLNEIDKAVIVIELKPRDVLFCLILIYRL